MYPRIDPAAWRVASELLIGPTMSKLAVFAVVLAASTTAHAGNPLEDGWIFGSDDDDEHPTVTLQAPELKSESTAMALSLVGTLAGGALMAASWSSDDGAFLALGAGALVLAPSAGHWYAGKALTWGLPVRLAGAGLVAAGAIAGATCYTASLGDDDCGAPGMVIGGLVAIGAGAVIDIATASSAAREYNARHWQVTPTLVSDGQSQGMGFGVSGSF